LTKQTPSTQLSFAASWRDDSRGPMQIISGPVGKSKVHFQAPESRNLKTEMRQFLTWANGKKKEDSLLRAGIAHLWLDWLLSCLDRARANSESFLAVVKIYLCFGGSRKKRSNQFRYICRMNKILRVFEILLSAPLLWYSLHLMV
jgi:hypothetical protein